MSVLRSTKIVELLIYQEDEKQGHADGDGNGELRVPGVDSINQCWPELASKT
jgi:hypothetical protein